MRAALHNRSELSGVFTVVVEVDKVYKSILSYFFFLKIGLYSAQVEADSA